MAYMTALCRCSVGKVGLKVCRLENKFNLNNLDEHWATFLKFCIRYIGRTRRTTVARLHRSMRCSLLLPMFAVSICQSVRPSVCLSVCHAAQLGFECRTQARRPQARRDTSPPVTSPPDKSPPQGGHKPARDGSKACHLSQDCLTGRLVHKISNYLQRSPWLSQCWVHKTVSACVWSCL